MKFPRATKRIGKCLAVISNNAGRKTKRGCPIVVGRTFVLFRGRWWKGHRLSFHLNKKKIPRSQRSRKRGFVLHMCDHGWCIEPSHLYLGTALQNVLDLYARHPTILEIRSRWQKGIPKGKRK